MKKYFLILIVAAVVFEIAADILFKYWSSNARGLFLWGGVAVYSIGTLIWAFSLKYEYLSKAVTIFTVLNLIAVVAVGVFLFKEDLSVVNKIGILLGVASVILTQL